VDKGSTVTLRVSKGPGQVQVPQVEGLSLQKATTALQKAGLFADSSSQSSDTVPKGQVISAEPSEGSLVQKGSHVRLEVSSGPEQVKVPSVVGKDSATAHSDLQQAGLKFSDEQQFSDSVPQGNVISQSPIAGDEVDKGSEVVLTISKGPDLVDVPSVVGLTEAEATGQIQAAGLKVQSKPIDVSDQAQNGLVVRQRPQAQPGAQLKRGRTVVLYIGNFKAPPSTTPGTP
jgi:serine/threonine-protein kinase